MSAIGKLILLIVTFLMLSQSCMAARMANDYYNETGEVIDLIEKDFEENGLNWPYVSVFDVHPLLMQVDHYQLWWDNEDGDKITGNFTSAAQANVSVQLYKKLKDQGCSEVNITLDGSIVGVQAIMDSTQVTSPDGKKFYFLTNEWEFDSGTDNSILEKALPAGFMLEVGNSTLHVRSPAVGLDEVTGQTAENLNDKLFDAGVDGIYF